MTWLGALAAVLILVVVAGVWRLMQGPIELDRLIPYVQQAFEGPGEGIGVSLSGLRIGIDPATHQVDLHLRDVKLSLPDGAPLATFPEVATSFSLGALLRGRIAPTHVVIDRALFELTRDAGGGFAFRIGDVGAAAGGVAPGNPLSLLAPLRPGTPWSRLRQVDIRNARIVLDDRATGRVWRADRAAATLSRSAEGVVGDVSVAVTLGSNTPDVHATARYVEATGKVDLDLAVDGLDPVELASLSPDLAPLSQARFPVSGTLALAYDVAAGRPDGGRIDLAFGAGQIATTLFAGGGLPISRGELHADYSPENAQLQLEQLGLSLTGGTRLVVTGKLGGVNPDWSRGGLHWPGDLSGDFGMTLSHVPAARLDELWPQGFSPGGRRWVIANITEGMLDELALRFAVKLDPAGGTATVAGARGTMRYHDLTINYFNGLPAARKVGGTATLGDRRIDFTATGASLKSMKATSGTVSITDLGAPTEWLTADFTVAGPVQDALEIIDAKPLHYAHEAGIDPARIGGKVETQLYFRLPLLDALKLDAVDYGVKATLAAVSYPKLALDRDLTDGDFTLDIDRAGARLQGKGRFDGTPTTLDATLLFHSKNGPRAHYRVGLTLDDAARRRLDWDFAPERASGPVGVDLVYTVLAGSRAQADMTLDLRGARLAVDELGWKKPPDTPATARLLIDLDNDVVTRVPELTVKAPGFDGRFALALGADRKRIDRVDIRRLVVADNDVAGAVTRRPDGGWRADIRSARLDLSREVRRAVADDDAADGTPPPLAVSARVERLILGRNRELRGVAADLLRAGGAWQTVHADGRYANGRKFSLRLGGEVGAGRLRFESDDLGATLQALGISDDVAGGTVTVDGSLVGAGNRRVLRAHLAGENYSLARGPTLARLLSLASLEGLVGMLSGTGIPFTTLRGDITYADGRITLDRLFAYGGALGITANGWFNPAQDRIDVQGTLAPAYSLNSLPGMFPIIGPLLMGGEGQALFAASFRLTGSNDNPTVAVNPLSGLTPGLLRHLFDPFLGAPQTSPPRAPAPPAASPSNPDAGN